MLARRTIQRELARTNAKLLDQSLDTMTRRELYGVRGALEWILTTGVQAPVMAALQKDTVVIDHA